MHAVIFEQTTAGGESDGQDSSMVIVSNQRHKSGPLLSVDL